MTDTSAAILVVEDDPLVADALYDILTGEQYAVSAVGSGEAALHALRAAKFDVVLLDLALPDADGLDLCRRLRANPALDATTIIALTARSYVEDRVRGLANGFDDYLTKPFRVAELKARLEASIRQSRRERQTSPLSLLPGNTAIEQVIAQRLTAGSDFAVCYLDIDRFKAYNDRYGFAAGDRIIRALADIAQRALEGVLDGFLGHVGGDDFVAVVPPDDVESFCRKVLDAFADVVRHAYTPEDLRRGSTESISRVGETVQARLVALSIAVVIQRDGRFRHVGQISHAAAELKSYLKRQGGGTFLVDRRRGAPQA